MNPNPESRARRILSKLVDFAPSDATTSNLLSELDAELVRIEGDQATQAEQLEQLAQAYQKLTAPANRIGVFLEAKEDGKALIALGETEFLALIDPKLEGSEDLQLGSRVMLNDAYAIVGFLPPHDGGEVLKVADVLESGHLRVSTDTQGTGNRFVWRAAALADATIKKGDEVRVEPLGQVAVEHMPHQNTRDYFMEEVPPIEWAQVGGQEQAIKLIRDTIEQPLLYPELFKRFDKKPIKGILLYGPPGCGKTLLGKATAYNLEIGRAHV